MSSMTLWWIEIHIIIITIIDLCVLCRLVCESEMEVTRAKLAHVITEIARITPLTPAGNRTQSWPIGMLPAISVSFIPVLTGRIK